MTGVAQDGPLARLAGAYDIEMDPWPGEAVSAYVYVSGIDASAIVYRSNGDYGSDHYLDAKLDGGNLHGTLSLGRAWFADRVGRFDLALEPDGATLAGTLQLGSRAHRMVWRRLAPQVESALLRSPGGEPVDHRLLWQAMDGGEVAEVRLDIRGRDFPRYRAALTDDTWYTVGARVASTDRRIRPGRAAGTTRGDGLRIALTLLPGVAPGRKRLVVEGTPVEFDLQPKAADAPDSAGLALESLRFVRAASGGWEVLDTVAYGESFQLEAVTEDVSSDPELSLTIELPGRPGAVAVTLYRVSGDSRTYRSRPLVGRAPAPSDWEPLD